MSLKKLGFIGCGNMANAIIGGIIHGGIAQADDIIGSNATKAGAERTKTANGIEVTLSNTEVVRKAETIFLCVKPQILDTVLDEIHDVVSENQLLVTIIAGKPLAYYEKKLGENIKLVRLMPNTPALVGEAMTAAVPNQNVSEEEMEYVTGLCEAFGKVEILPENLFDAVTAVSGSSPAYVFMFIEAMADAGVQGGLPRAAAYRLAAQAVLGSAKMVLESGKHPAELKDMVTSPAGTTIEAVRVLEEKGFRSAVFECVKACTEKSAQMGKGEDV